ncbi:MAG: hypothetical protein ABSF62_19835, partial [Bryobacteraceae bacterium]
GGWIAEGLDPADDLVLAEGGAVRAGHGIRRDAVDGVGDVALEAETIYRWEEIPRGLTRCAS